jgi:sensor histidine kinase YesM
MGWIFYAAGWVVLALLWSGAAAMSSNMPALLTLKFGFLLMGTAGAMGVGVWWLTGQLPWGKRSPRFFVGHLIGILLYATSYVSVTFFAEAWDGSVKRVLSAALHSPIFGWNLLMGSWLYLIVAALSYSIRLQQRLSAQAQAETEARMLAERAQLSALRARLNPHFLFNALHTVSSLVTTDPAAADDAIERLGGLLRYALDEDTDDVPLCQEWAFTRDYLAFERLRLGERLRVDESFEHAALQCRVPLLVLQPLVENAVRHAIAPRPEGGTIRVSAHVERGALKLLVEDDGPGSDPQLCDEQEGVGLGALRRRLVVRYGAAAGVEIRTAPGAGFAVTVTLPALADAEAGAA